MKCFRKLHLLKCAQGPKVAIFKETLKEASHNIKTNDGTCEEECGVSCLFIFPFLFFWKVQEDQTPAT